MCIVTVVLLLKSQADDINIKFNEYNEKISYQQAILDSQRTIILHRSTHIDSVINALDVALKANATLFQYNLAYREAFNEMFKNICVNKKIFVKKCHCILYIKYVNISCFMFKTKCTTC